MSEGRPTFYSPNNEALCRALIDFLDTDTTRKEQKYLNSRTHTMMQQMHVDWMTRNGETDPFKVNRFKRICQVVDLAWIEAKFPDLYTHLLLNAGYYVYVFQGKTPNCELLIKEHENCLFCKTDGAYENTASSVGNPPAKGD